MMRATTALFLRSMRSETRRWRPALLRLAVGGMLLLLLASAAQSAWRGAGGRDLLSLCAWVAMAAISALGIPLFAGTVAEEKEDGTLALLRLAGIRPLALILGGGVARLWHLLLALAPLPPVAVLAVTLGGVSLPQVAAVGAVLAAHLLLLASAGLLASVLSGTATRANSLCVGLLAAWMAGLPALGLLVSVTGAPAWLHAAAGAAAWLGERSPPALLGEVLSVQWLGSWPWDGLGLAAGAGFAGLLAAWWLLPRCTEDTPEVPAPGRHGWAAAWRRPLNRLRRRPPSGALRAVAWKDVHLPAGGWPLAIVKVVAVGGLVALFTLVGHSSEPGRAFGQGLMATAGLAVIGECGIHLSRTWSEELRQRTAEALLLLPISLGGLVAAKAWAAARACLPMGGLIVLGALCAPADAQALAAQIFGHLWGWVAIATIVYFWAWCLWLSPTLRRLALAAAILIPIATWLVAGLALASLREEGDLVAGLMALGLTITAGVLVVSTPQRVRRRIQVG